MNDERNLGEKTDDSGQQPRYEHYQFHEEQGTVLKPSGPSGHRRNQNSFQKKAGTTIAPVSYTHLTLPTILRV